MLRLFAFTKEKGFLSNPKSRGHLDIILKTILLEFIFIKRSQELGFTLNETKELLDLKIKNQSRCGDVLSKTEEKIKEINQKINDLKKMKKSLEGLANCCVDSNQPLSDCPILDCFLSVKG
jgi:hypothetical protein